MLSRFKLAAILMSFEVASYIVLSCLPNGEYLRFAILGSNFAVSPAIYFFIAGAFSFAILPVIASVGSDQLVIDLLKLALIMLVFQFVGLIAYYFDLPANIYQWPVHGLVYAQFLRLFILRDGDGVERHNNFLHLLCRPHFERNSHLC